MGNCQAGEAATVAIQHPSGRVERFYWQLKANEVMAANPGHYVAVIVTAVASTSESAPVRYLKLLRPDDTLHIGHVYRLVSFEDVLRDFGSKKRVRLSKLLVKPEDTRKSNHQRERKEKEGEDDDCGGEDSRQESSSRSTTVEAEQQEEQIPPRVDNNSSFDIRGTGGSVSRHGQWRPTLQSIAEAGF